MLEARDEEIDDGEEEPVVDVRRVRRVSTAAVRDKPSWCCKRCISACTAWRKVRVWARARASVQNNDDEELLLLLLLVVAQSKGVCACCCGCCCLPPPPPLLLSMIPVLNVDVVMTMRRQG